MTALWKFLADSKHSMSVGCPNNWKVNLCCIVLSMFSALSHLSITRVLWCGYYCLPAFYRSETEAHRREITSYLRAQLAWSAILLTHVCIHSSYSLAAQGHPGDDSMGILLELLTRTEAQANLIFWTKGGILKDLQVICLRATAFLFFFFESSNQKRRI